MNKIILSLIAVFLVSPANADESNSQGPLLQVGLALRVTPDNHQMLNYLYLQNTANTSDAIIKTSGVKRMHMVNAGKGMSSRWLKKVLMEDILVNNDSPTPVEGSDEPGIKKNEIKTKLLVSDGDIVVIGGIKKQDTSNLRGQTPGLGSVPVVGNLFKSRQKKDELTELLIFLAPRVIR